MCVVLGVIDRVGRPEHRSRPKSDRDPDFSGFTTRAPVVTRNFLWVEKIKLKVVKQDLYGGKIYFQHDNAKSHIPKIVTVKIVELGRELLLHSPYSQDLALLTITYFAV